MGVDRAAHAGSAEMNCLNGKTGTYEANEGMWIQTIIKKFGEDIKSLTT